MLEEKRFADEAGYTAAAAAMERELARLKVVRKHRARKTPIISGAETEQES
jgi:hypothetical protein